MLLSPIGSPTRTLAHLALPPIAHPQEQVPLRLPVELIVIIVEHAAHISKRCGSALCLVSSWVRITVLPIMYATVVLHGPSNTPDRDRDRDRIDGPPFPAPPPALCSPKLSSPLLHIQHLWLDVAPERCPPSISACPALVQLALHLDAHASVCRSHRPWRPFDLGAAILDIDAGNEMDTMHCRSFTVLGQSHPSRWLPFAQNPAGLAFLRGLTHLRLLNMCLSHYIPLEYMPNLTHLCIPYFDLRTNDGSEFVGLDYILSMPKLEMVVLTLNPRYWRFEEMSLKSWACLAMSKDIRLYVVASTRQDATKDWDDPRRDWEHEANGGPSIWEKALQVRRKFLARISRTFS